MPYLIFLFFLINSVYISAQKEIALVWKDKSFALENTFQINDTTEIRISTFKCYIQDSFNKVILLDAHMNNSWKVATTSQFFQIGLSPDIQTSSNFQGPLDPVNGMYWAWNTGFMSIKCVGEIISRTTRQTQHFEFHLGGYEAPFACIYRIPGHGHKLEIDLNKWFGNLLNIENNTFEVMRPCKEGVSVFTQFCYALKYV